MIWLIIGGYLVIGIFLSIACNVHELVNYKRSLDGSDLLVGILLWPLVSLFIVILSISEFIANLIIHS